MIERSCHRHCHITSGRIPGNNSASYVTVKISLRTFTVIFFNLVLGPSWSHDVYLWINICLILTHDLEVIIYHRSTCSIYVFVQLFTWYGCRRSSPFSQFCSSRNRQHVILNGSDDHLLWQYRQQYLQLCVRSWWHDSWNGNSVLTKIDPVACHQQGLSFRCFAFGLRDNGDAFNESCWLLLDVALSMAHWCGGVHWWVNLWNDAFRDFRFAESLSRYMGCPSRNERQIKCCFLRVEKHAAVKIEKVVSDFVTRHSSKSWPVHWISISVLKSLSHFTREQ